MLIIIIISDNLWVTFVTRFPQRLLKRGRCNNCVTRVTLYNITSRNQCYLHNSQPSLVPMNLSLLKRREFSSLNC